MASIRIIFYALFVLMGMTDNAMADDYFGHIKTQEYDWDCLHADGPDDTPTFRNCNASDSKQYWFRARDTMRNVAYPNRCLTAVPGDHPNGSPYDVLALRACDGREAQNWEPNGRGTRLEGEDGVCAQTTHDRLYAVNCGHHRDRQTLDADLKKVNNSAIADFSSDYPNVNLPGDHRFAVYEACAAQNGDETDCFINLGNVQRYGHNYGTDIEKLDNLFGGGSQSGGTLLDLGDRYSADRCALAHDTHYWYPEGSDHPFNFNDWNFLMCLNNVIPTTRQESNAIHLGKFMFNFKVGADLSGLLLSESDDDNLAQGVRESCLVDWAGTLPSAGQPIHSCWCRAYLPPTKIRFTQMETSLQAATLQITAGRPISNTGLAALDAQLATLEASPIVSGNIPDSDATMKCGGSVKSDFDAQLYGTDDTDQREISILGNIIIIEARKGIEGIEERIENLKTANDAFYETTSRQIIPGDTLWDIAMAKGVDDFSAYIARFANLNPDVRPDLIYAEQVYQLPALYARE